MSGLIDSVSGLVLRLNIILSILMVVCLSTGSIVIGIVLMFVNYYLLRVSKALSLIHDLWERRDD